MICYAIWPVLSWLDRLLGNPRADASDIFVHGVFSGMTFAYNRRAV